jgi:hypothetical protein
MFSMMYTINTDANGVILTCNECLRTVRVNEFDDELGSPRTQAASAMLKHIYNGHGKVPIKPLPQIMERRF